MSFKPRRTLNDSTNNKRLKNNDSGQFKTRSFNEDDSMFDDDDVFHDGQSVTSKSTNQNQSRKRLYGTSSYRTKKIKNQRIEKENVLIDETLNQLREEQARIDAHSLSLNVK